MVYFNSIVFFIWLRKPYTKVLIFALLVTKPRLPVALHVPCMKSGGKMSGKWKVERKVNRRRGSYGSSAQAVAALVGLCWPKNLICRMPISAITFVTLLLSHLLAVGGVLCFGLSVSEIAPPANENNRSTTAEILWYIYIYKKRKRKIYIF